MMFTTLCLTAQVFTSPDKQLKVELSNNGGLAFSLTDGATTLISKTSIGMDLQTSTGTINVSNVMLVCPSCKAATRVGHRYDEAGKKHRVCKKCGKDID